MAAPSDLPLLPLLPLLPDLPHLPLLPVLPRLPAPTQQTTAATAALLRGLRHGLLGLLTWCLFAASWASTHPLSAAAIERQFRGGERTQALKQLDQALAQHPRDAGLRFLQTVMLTESGRSAEASRLLEQLSEDYPELPEPYNNLAVLQAAEGQLDRARSLLEAALRLDPGYRTAHQNLGDVLLRLGQRAYEAAAAGVPADTSLQAKLRQLRELTGVR